MKTISSRCLAALLFHIRMGFFDAPMEKRGRQKETRTKGDSFAPPSVELFLRCSGWLRAESADVTSSPAGAQMRSDLRAAAARLEPISPEKAFSPVF